MSIGNLKTDGGKGTNWPWQYRMLKGLQGIIDVINSTANGSEYEAKLVNITCTGVPFNGTELYLEVRVWDTVTGGFTGNPTYYLPGSTVGVPLATFTDAGCDITYLEAGDATEATLQAILTQNTQIAENTGETDTVVTVNSPYVLRVTEIQPDNTIDDTIPESVKSISFSNAASVNARISTASSVATGPILLKPGETITFDAGGNGNRFPANELGYNPNVGGVGDLLIIYTV